MTVHARRRSVIAAAAALGVAGLAPSVQAQSKLKVAGIYTVPVEQ